MRKETAVQVQSEIETVESEIRKMEYHLVGVIVDNTAKLSVFRTEASDVIERGTRIAQGVIAPVETAHFVEVDELSDSERGKSGFGSTGTK
ncbi:deoxyuridine 5'-triphosphate nucleotidohydrolase [Bacillus cereus]|nr:deoxyuridine 5'-triphosphate nucleotidohydrolase [Bacillus cereus]WJE54897.1 deoxyuridine 5'-triphosphate nucleotidohydrolase [Bacillus cereus]